MDLHRMILEQYRQKYVSIYYGQYMKKVKKFGAQQSFTAHLETFLDGLIPAAYRRGPEEELTEIEGIRQSPLWEFVAKPGEPREELKEKVRAESPAARRCEEDVTEGEEETKLPCQTPAVTSWDKGILSMLERPRKGEKRAMEERTVSRFCVADTENEVQKEKGSEPDMDKKQ